MTKTSRVALFIDAENASPTHFNKYLAICHDKGQLAIRRCYGSVAALKKWDAAMRAHYIQPIQTPPAASKANAADFSLTIDAVALLHENRFDCAVIASSDSDFTQLAMHIREHGRQIHGIGESKAPAEYKAGFDSFTVVAARSVKAVPEVKVQDKKPTASTKAAMPTDTIKKVIDCFNDQQKDGAIQLSQMGKALASVMGNTSYHMGYGGLTKFLQKTGKLLVQGNIVKLKV